MDCVEITEILLAEEAVDDPEVDRHVDSCPGCAHIARGLKRLNSVLSATLVVRPPDDLQLQLMQLVVAHTQPARRPWWQRVRELDLSAWLQRPQMVAAQGLAAVMLALASWQIFGLVSAFQPVVGDVAYAMTLVAASPAVAYVGNVQIDFQSLGIWSMVGIAGWLISENGPVGRRIASSGLRLP